MPVTPSLLLEDVHVILHPVVTPEREGQLATNAHEGELISAELVAGFHDEDLLTGCHEPWGGAIPRFRRRPHLMVLYEDSRTYVAGKQQTRNSCALS